MTNYCRVVDNFCMEVFASPNEFGFTIDECFTPEVRAMFEEVPDWVEPNATRDADGVWHPRTDVRPGEEQEEPDA